MALAAVNPGSATAAGNSTNSAAGDVGGQTGSADSAAGLAKSGGGELSAFTGKCDALGEDLIASLQTAEGEGIDTGNGLGESAADGVNTDETASGNYGSVPPINVQIA